VHAARNFGVSAEELARAHALASQEGANPAPPDDRAAFPIRCQNNVEHVDPRVLSLAKNFRRKGLPIVQLWQSGRNLLAVGSTHTAFPGFTSRRKSPSEERPLERT
jgi:hypothetical protein